MTTTDAAQPMNPSPLPRVIRRANCGTLTTGFVVALQAVKDAEAALIDLVSDQDIEYWKVILPLLQVARDVLAAYQYPPDPVTVALAHVAEAAKPLAIALGVTQSKSHFADELNEALDELCVAEARASGR